MLKEQIRKQQLVIKNFILPDVDDDELLRSDIPSLIINDKCSYARTLSESERERRHIRETYGESLYFTLCNSY